MEEIKLQTPIQTITVDGFSLFLKRDDLIHPDFSGNKARKLHYYLAHELPHIKKIISYGSAQSNAMYSLSILAKMRGWKFEYYTHHVASYLAENPHGNYAKALENGMKIVVKEEGVRKKEEGRREGVLFVEEGGRDLEASFGLKIMADEIRAWQETNNIQNLNIFLPSGTGTTALFLQKSLFLSSTLHPLPCCLLPRVYTTPCVGDSAYLKKQFFMLEENEAYHPTIISPPKKWHFGKLYSEHYKIWLKLHKQTGIEFDMLYDPIGWQVLLENFDSFDGALLYIHQGGVLGNESMLPRYQRKYKDMA